VANGFSVQKMNNTQNISESEKRAKYLTTCKARRNIADLCHRTEGRKERRRAMAIASERRQHLQMAE
jgi:hypothetical protein